MNSGSEPLQPVGDEDGRSYVCFCDESRTGSERYMVFGALIAARQSLAGFSEAVKAYRSTHNMTGEMKWTKVSEQKEAEYRAFVDVFFDRCTSETLHFKCVVFDSHAIDYRGYHDGDKVLGRYKLFYTFLLHTLGDYVQTNADRIQILFDEFPAKYSLRDFRTVLNAGFCKQFGKCGQIITAVEAARSHERDELQMADVLMGAVGFHRNRRHMAADTRLAKIRLAKYVAKKAGLGSLNDKPPRSSRHFGIWPFEFKNKRRPRS